MVKLYKDDCEQRERQENILLVETRSRLHCSKNRYLIKYYKKSVITAWNYKVQVNWQYNYYMQQSKHLVLRQNKVLALKKFITTLAKFRTSKVRTRISILEVGYIDPTQRIGNWDWTNESVVSMNKLVEKKAFNICYTIIQHAILYTIY